jgi:hypothetical protein
MEATVTRNVNNMGADEKKALEGMLGGSLSSDQQVFILAYTPGAIPDDASRAAAKERLQKAIFSSHAASGSVLSSEADDAVAEAMAYVRRRR